MKFTTTKALEFCRARSLAIFADDASFLGTASAVGPNTFLACYHCVQSQERINNKEIEFNTELLFPGSDLAVIKSSTTQNHPFFIISSETIQFGEAIMVYGFRLRDGKESDVIISTDIGSTDERIFAPGHGTRQVCGFGKRNLLEPGMSGGVVLRASTFEMIGYVVGYDHPKNSDRKDDIFVILSSAIAQSNELRGRLTFSHQRRATFVNLTRRLVLLSGFRVKVECLGQEPGLDECLFCSRGNGILTQTILVVTATPEQTDSKESLVALKELLETRSKSRGIQFDRTIVVVEEKGDDDNLDDFVVSVNDLRIAAKTIVTSELFDKNYPDADLVANRFLARSVARVGGSTPEPAIEALNKALNEGVKIIIIVGPTDSGKRTLVEKYRSITEALLLSADNDAPTISCLSLSTELDESSFLSMRGQGSIVIIISDLSETEEIGKSLRKLKLVLTRLNANFKEWTIIVTLDGNFEQAKRILGSITTELRNAGDGVILELLPLSAEVVREAFHAELGKTDGDAYWNIVTSSQEIFQIAQWPAGLSIILDRALKASLGCPRLDQVQIIAALVNAYLSRSTHGLPPVATFNFLVAIAKEMNAAQQMHVAIDRARKIYAGSSPAPHIIHTIAVSDILVPGLLTLTQDGQTVGFESPIFVHYFLAIGIMNSIGVADLSQDNPLFHRRIPVALLNDVVDLGIEKARLWALIQTTIGKSAKEVGFIGGNCVSLLRLLHADFRNANFAKCDIRGGIFAGCDLSGADFSSSTMVDVGLANSNLQNTNFTDADLNRADLKSGCTIYQFANRGHLTFAATSSRRLICINHSNYNLKIDDIVGFSDAVFSVAISTQENLIIAGGQDGTIRGWDFVNREPRFILRGHFSDIRSLAFVENRVVSGSVDGHINIWAPWSAALLSSFETCGGEIWSLGVLNSTSVAVLCNRSHVHIMNMNGTEIKRYDLPKNHAYRLSLDRSRDRIFVGGEGYIWSLDWRREHVNIIRIPHPFVRAVFHTAFDDFLIGGGYGIVLSADNTFSRFETIGATGEDYIADFTTFSPDTAIGGDAGGKIILFERNAGQWLTKGKLGELGLHRGLYALGSDFRQAKHVPMERRERLAEAGALIT